MWEYEKKTKLEESEICALLRFQYLSNCYYTKKIIACKHGYRKLNLKYHMQSVMYEELYNTYLDELIKKYEIQNIDRSNIYICIEELEIRYNETK